MIQAIQDNFTTLRQIADHTGISYRSVNGFITSLEKQKRVRAADYGVKRGNQQFSLLMGGDSGRELQGSTPTIDTLQSVFGIYMPAPQAGAYEARVHLTY